MNDLASHIEYLLLEHDCVMVPGLGAFLSHESPAAYDDVNSLFNPPSVTLGFNQALTLNDGLLVESVARRSGVSLEEARQLVETTVTSFRRQLAEGSVLPVGRLGEMSADGETLVFDPADHSVVSLRYRGMAPLSIRPLATAVEREVASAATEPAAAHERQTMPVLLKVAASLIMAAVGCGLFFTTGNLVGSRGVSNASLDSGLRSRFEAQIPAADMEQSLPVSREIRLNIAIPDPAAATASVVPGPRQVNLSGNDSTPASEPGRYLLVVASFPSEKLARKHIGNNTGLDVIEMDGRYRVYAASAATLSRANELIRDLSADYSSVWICRR